MGWEVSCVDCSRSSAKPEPELGKALAYLCGLPLALLCYSFVVRTQSCISALRRSNRHDTGSSLGVTTAA